MIPLPAVLDQRSVETLREHCLAALSGGGIALDASSVERAGTVGLQLLLSAGRTASDAGSAFAIHAPSAAFRDTIAALGLTPHFSAWIRP